MLATCRSPPPQAAGTQPALTPETQQGDRDAAELPNPKNRGHGRNLGGGALEDAETRGLHIRGNIGSIRLDVWLQG